MLPLLPPFTGTLGANNQFYKEYSGNALNWYKKSQERCLYLNHAIVNPPIDRQASPEQVRDVYVHVEKETDAGVIVSIGHSDATYDDRIRQLLQSHPAPQ